MSNRASTISVGEGSLRGRRTLPKRGQIKSRIAANAFLSIVSMLSRARDTSTGPHADRKSKTIRKAEAVLNKKKKEK